MIIAIGVMFVTGLLLVAAFTVAQGEVTSTRLDATQKQAYYAALAGVQEYEYQLQANPDYWENCTGPASSVPEESSERYEVKVLKAESAPKGTTECVSTNPFATAIESEGPLANTFRIKSTGYAGTEKRSIVATFKVTGFLDYIYYTNFETKDPALYNNHTAGEECKGLYYKEWSPKKLKCEVITFFTGDKVDGPMHTNDSTRVEGTAAFGRPGQKPADTVEILGGTYPEDSEFKCSGSPVFYTASKCYEKGETVIPPESDTSLTAYVEESNKFTGQTWLTLNGTTNTISVTRYEKGKKIEEPNHPWPKNGLIYVAAETCSWAFEQESEKTDSKEEQEKTRGCGTVYVSGTYSKSLTIAGENSVVVNGNVSPTGVALGSAPSGTATLGLIATEYVRVFHPCTPAGRFGNGTNGEGSMENPFIYAAILSTAHSFIVDNPACGESLGKLNVYGAIAQDYRGVVATSGGTGYEKEYKYDYRLATDEPPYFLAPLKAGWKVIRETAPSPG